MEKTGTFKVRGALLRCLPRAWNFLATAGAKTLSPQCSQTVAGTCSTTSSSSPTRRSTVIFFFTISEWQTRHFIPTTLNPSLTEVQPLVWIRFVESNNPDLWRQRALHMNWPSLSCPTKDQATRPIFIFRIFFDNRSVENDFRDALFSNFSFNAALDCMLPPRILSFKHLILY
jgi:hypothetical protein